MLIIGGDCFMPVQAQARGQSGMIPTHANFVYTTVLGPMPKTGASHAGPFWFAGPRACRNYRVPTTAAALTSLRSSLSRCHRAPGGAALG